MKTLTLTNEQAQSLFDTLLDYQVDLQHDLVICSYTDTREKLTNKINQVTDIVRLLEQLDE